MRSDEQKSDEKSIDPNLERHFMDSFMFTMTTTVLRSYLHERYGKGYKQWMNRAIDQWKKGQLSMLDEDIKRLLEVHAEQHRQGPHLLNQTPDVEELRTWHVAHIKHVAGLLRNNFIQ